MSEDNCVAAKCSGNWNSNFFLILISIIYNSYFIILFQSFKLFLFFNLVHLTHIIASQLVLVSDPKIADPATTIYTTCFNTKS